MSLARGPTCIENLHAADSISYNCFDADVDEDFPLIKHGTHVHMTFDALLCGNGELPARTSDAS
ncbi:MAG TPA: hypothetical protein DHW02_03130 [Ktedonobacter sp.]|nr:hypothetical protein [Ktedonobacter sp.]